MKKISIVTLAFILAASFAACGRRNNTPDTQITILPTIETNIPDPEVDTSMPDMTDMIDGTEDASGNSGLAK